jgi:hypothetical protein
MALFPAWEFQLKAFSIPDGVQIRVGAGYAISPQGRWIWLENDLCARLDEWVRSHNSEFSPPLSSGPQTVM